MVRADSRGLDFKAGTGLPKERKRGLNWALKEEKGLTGARWLFLPLGRKYVPEAIGGEMAGGPDESGRELPGQASQDEPENISYVRVHFQHSSLVSQQRPRSIREIQ